MFLPSAPKSIYFNRTSPEKAVTASDSPEKTPTNLSALQLLWFHVKTAYSNFTVVRYSVWSALASCVYYQTVLYVQVLWRKIGHETLSSDVVYWNGAVEAALTVCSAMVTFSAGFVPAVALEVRSALAGLSWISLTQGGILLMAAFTRSLCVAYAAHICYSILHSFAMTLLSAEIAKNICRDSFGLVFGINATVGSLLQIVITLVVVDGAGLFHTTINGQFLVYSGICVTLGALFCLFLIVELRSVWKWLFILAERQIVPKDKAKVDGNANIPDV